MNIDQHTNIVDVTLFGYSDTEDMTTLGRAQHVVELIKQSASRKHVINVLGYEIFSDTIGVHLFFTYHRFFEIIRIACDALGVQFQVNWVTDMVFKENREMVSWLLEKTHGLSKLKTTYKFVGCGISLNDRMTFQNNMRIYKDRLDCVSVILNTPSIRKLLADNDKYFKNSLYGEYPLTYQLCSPGKMEKKLVPAEQEVQQTLAFIAEKYPKIQSL